MELLESERVNISSLISKYNNRIENERQNRERIRRFYNDEESFNDLMNRIIKKDFEKLEELTIDGYSPTPWNVMFVIMDIVQHEGNFNLPYDVLTRAFQSRTLKYMGWTFSMVHGENTVTSIYNRENELIYRF